LDGFAMLKRILLLTGLLILIVSVTCGQDEWQYRPGILLTSGDQTHTFKDGSGEILSINGWRRVSRAELDQISICHVIILLPRRRLISQGGSFSNQSSISTEKLSWTVLNPPDDFKTGEEHSFEMSYDSPNNLVALAGQKFDLSHGNLFVVRFDENWTVAAEQISAHFFKRAKSEAVLNFFKFHLRRDKPFNDLP
jgi:hypothetical protein